MQPSLKNIHKATNKPTPVENADQHWSDAWLIPVVIISSQRQQIQWLQHTNRAQHLISHWFTAWPSPPPFRHINAVPVTFFFYHMVRKILFPCFSKPHKLWEPITVCEMLWIHVVWAQLRERMVITHSFHFPAHINQFSVPQPKWSHPNLVSPQTPAFSRETLQCKSVKQAREIWESSVDMLPAR